MGKPIAAATAVTVCTHCCHCLYSLLIFSQATYFTGQYFLGNGEGKSKAEMELVERPTIVRVKSAELLHKTGSPFGHDHSNPAPKR